MHDVPGANTESCSVYFLVDIGPTICWCLKEVFIKLCLQYGILKQILIISVAIKISWMERYHFYFLVVWYLLNLDEVFIKLHVQYPIWNRYPLMSADKTWMMWNKSKYLRWFLVPDVVFVWILGSGSFKA